MTAIVVAVGAASLAGCNSGETLPRGARAKQPTTPAVQATRQHAALKRTLATNLDGGPGRDLILGEGMGAANTFFRVLVDYGDRLRWLPPPPHSEGCEVGGTVGTGTQTFACPPRKLATIEGQPQRRTPVEGDYVVTTTVYRWSYTHWRMVSRDRHTGRVPEHTDRQRCGGAELLSF